ncbi:PREDICTED: uncharacterized protein LOC106792560 [Polistes canadensis]|uniref:uncharacterized protein LOC106792560 n=1 Tax=Polistes canadensis TaxID=91411 RepID=UPI000718C5D3|nr:PREDICTED: uncharacterized protein LOC106792560 [Polistes canadensis]
MAAKESNEDQLNNSISSTTSSMEIESLKSQLKVASLSPNPTMKIEEWLQLFEKLLSMYKQELYDESIFSQILPMVHSLLCQVFKLINIFLTSTTESNILSNIKDKLFDSSCILHFYKKSMEYAFSCGKISIEYVKSLSETLLSSTNLIFEHFQLSSNTYGKFFKDLSNDLKSLFQKTNEIFSIFLIALDDVIIFDVKVESEMTSLLNVITLLGAVAANLQSLDLKFFVKVTMIFGKLAMTYISDIKKISPEKMLMSFQQITEKTNLLYSTVLDPNSKMKEWILRSACLILNVIIRLTSAYNEYLSDDFLFTLTELLLKLYRCIALLTNSITNDMLKNDISSTTTNLLNALLKTNNFNQIYFQYGKKKDGDKLGFHLLTLAILEVINKIPYDRHCIWILGSQSVLDVVFTNFNYLQEELYTEELQLTSNYSFEKKAGSNDLYTITLISSSKFIISMPYENFHVVEKILLKHLLSGYFWSSLLSSDVWYLVGRYSSSDLCSSHVKYLMRTYAVLIERNDTFEVCILRNLISRLYTLLQENEKHSVVIELDDIDACLWTPFSQLLPNQMRMVIWKRLAFRINNIQDLVDDFFEEPSERQWYQLMKLIPATNKFNSSVDTEIFNVVSKLWEFITNIIEECEYRYLFILSDFSMSMLDGTKYDFFNKDSIINAIDNLSLHALPHAKIKIAYYLEDLIATFKKYQPNNVINGVVKIHSRLLEDENPWVYQENLECFDRFSSTCLSEGLVVKIADTISGKSMICDSVPAYLSRKQYYKLQDVPDIKFYLLCLVKNSLNRSTRHICMNFKDSKKDVKIPRIETETIKCNITSQELNERVNSICEELRNLLKRKSDINEVSLRNLRTVLTRLTE